MKVATHHSKRRVRISRSPFRQIAACGSAFAQQSTSTAKRRIASGIPSPHAPIAQAYRKKRCKAWAAGQIWKPCRMCTSTRRKKTWKMPAGCWPFFNRLWHGMWQCKASKNSIRARIKRLLFYRRCDKKSAEIPKFRHFDMNKTISW